MPRAAVFEALSAQVSAIPGTRKGIPLDSQADSDFLKLSVPSNTGLSSTDFGARLARAFFVPGLAGRSSFRLPE